MIAVQVRDEDRLDPVGIEAEPLQTDERGCPAVEQYLAIGGGDVIARLQAPARAERVAASDNRYLHDRLALVRPRP